MVIDLRCAATIQIVGGFCYPCFLVWWLGKRYKFWGIKPKAVAGIVGYAGI
ncbi:MAG: hypothetical protein QXO20_04010 [Candidatus Bathyarchaeia archaeon]